MLSLTGSDRINSILGNDQYLFEVPIYQRRYVWDKPNWEKLWEDIDAQVNIPPAERGVGHFTGPIVTRIIDDRIHDRRQRFEVIDGQQRLTTLEIIFCVIRDLCSGVAGLKNDSAIKTARGHVMSSDDDHKLSLTKYDKRTFKKIVEEEYGKKIHSAFNLHLNCLDEGKVKEIRSHLFGEEVVSANILGAYDYFYTEIRKTIGNDDKKVSGLLFTITSNFKFIHLSLVGTEDAEKVFESINATGRMLSDFDYLRNNLFLRARKLGIDEEKDKLYRDIYYDNPKYWPFEENWEAEQLKEFLKVFIEVTRPPERPKKENAKPFEEYLEYSKYLEKAYPKDAEKIPYEFTQLRKWAESYQSLQNKPAFADYKNFCEDLSLRDLDSFLLLLDSFLLFVEHTNSDQLIDATKILESYIIRSLLVSEEEGCTHADIKKHCFKTIKSYFRRAVSESFCLNSFKAELLVNNTDLDNAASEHVFWWVNIQKKNAAFIAYVFNRIIQEHPGTPLEGYNWEMYQELQTNIEELLVKESNTRSDLIEQFETLWPKLG